MALTVDEDVAINSNAGKLFTLISNQHHTVPKAASDRVHNVEIHEGDWETSGSVKQWKYTLDGNVETLKEKVEIDEANKVVSLTALEGSHVLDVYKCYKIIFKVTPKSEGEGGVVKVTLEYQKHNETDPPPEKYMSFLVNCIQDIDAHLLKE